MAGKPKSMKDKFADAESTGREARHPTVERAAARAVRALQAGNGGGRVRLAPGPARPQGPREVRRLVEAEGPLEGRRDERLRRDRGRLGEGEGLSRRSADFRALLAPWILQSGT